MRQRGSGDRVATGADAVRGRVGVVRALSWSVAAAAVSASGRRRRLRRWLARDAEGRTERRGPTLHAYALAWLNRYAVVGSRQRAREHAPGVTGGSADVRAALLRPGDAFARRRPSFAGADLCGGLPSSVRLKLLLRQGLRARRRVGASCGTRRTTREDPRGSARAAPPEGRGSSRRC
jgi:hypothetical protein